MTTIFSPIPKILHKMWQEGGIFMTLWFLGGDARSRYAAQYLSKQGYAVQTCGVPECTDAPLAEQLSYVILPFPSFDGYHIRNSSLAAEELLQRTHEHTKLFGGLFGAWQEVFCARGATVYDLYGSEPLTTANAVPTAEGAICLAIENSEITLHGASCLVVGFGRCGKVLAERLQALHAHVTVGLRSAKDAAMAHAQGFRTDTTGLWHYELSDYDFVFNTVPTAVFSSEQLGQIRPDCLVMELSNGGILSEHQRFLHYLYAPALPGRFCPKSAGILYAKSILGILEKEKLS